MIKPAFKKDHFTENDCRLKRMERVLITIGLLSPLRFGCTSGALMRDLHEAGYQVCERTVFRDLLMLERLNMVRRTSPGHWQWCGIGPRAAVVAMAGQERAAE